MAEINLAVAMIATFGGCAPGRNGGHERSCTGAERQNNAHDFLALENILRDLNFRHCSRR